VVAVAATHSRQHGKYLNVHSHRPFIGERVLVTGASGEMGQALVSRLASMGAYPITLDVQPSVSADGENSHHVVGSVADAALLERILTAHDVDQVFHLAALLSARSEQDPTAAHVVNVEGIRTVLDAVQRRGERSGRRIRVLYPSSIAVFGVPPSKDRLPPLGEDDWNRPITIYGCHKLFGEHLGRYYAHHYRPCGADQSFVDFRSIRFPGLISATTRPTGGTSDYAPEMLHAAAQGVPCVCFARPDTQIPFMTMVDAVDALLQLAGAPEERLSRTVYNVSAFSATAEQIWSLLAAAFPHAAIRWAPDSGRQRILDSWPSQVDCTAACQDWEFSPRFDFAAAFNSHLIPLVEQQYRFAM
jgi:nucleoside-diphosphate-sugar epimerase